MKIREAVFSLWTDCYVFNNQLILGIKRNYRKWSNVLLLVLSPWILINWLCKKAYHCSIAKKNVVKFIEKDNARSFPHEVAIVAIAKNEGLYVEEWVAYHKIIGVSKIYFYDNESTDNTKAILQKYIDDNFIDYKYIVGTGQQLTAYNDAINLHKNECRYMAFIDLDEFMMPTGTNNSIDTYMKYILKKGGSNAAGVSVNWCMYGNSHYEKRPKGLVTESYIHRGETQAWQNRLIKTVCNPRLVKTYISPHYPIYKLGAIPVNANGEHTAKLWYNRNVTFENMRLNHYKCKSMEDYFIKTSRGLGDRKGTYASDDYEKYNLNDIKDTSMIAYSKDLRRMLGLTANKE